MERRFHGCESSMERKFLEHSLLLRSDSSRGAKFPWNESSWTFRSPGTNVPRNEGYTGAKVLSIWTFRPRERKCRGTKRPDTVQTLLVLYAALGFSCSTRCPLPKKHQLQLSPPRLGRDGGSLGSPQSKLPVNEWAMSGDDRGAVAGSSY